MSSQLSSVGLRAGLPHLILDRVRDGSVVKRFDHTPPPEAAEDIVCPHFLELKWSTGCPFACAWCYLQGTFRFLPYHTRPRFKPTGKVRQHLLEFWQGDSQPEILNAGELSDALMGERNGHSLVRLVSDLVPEAGPHRVLLVTKADWTENLIEVDRPDLFIVSFSVNAPAVADRWEKGAPHPHERLDAAAELAAHGYQVRLRLDPLVPIPQWRQAYRFLISAVFDRFTPERITLGSLRGLQSTINNARDRSWVEFLSERSHWGRRVEAGLRHEVFGTVLEELRTGHGFTRVALCKEPVEMWEALGMDWRQPRCNCVW